MYLLVYRDLERRIVEAEMELTLAKSQGYLKGQGQRSGSSDRRLLAVIGVYTGFGSKLKRNVFRGSWMPRGLFSILVIRKEILVLVNFGALELFICIFGYEESVRIGLVREWVGRIR